MVGGRDKSRSCVLGRCGDALAQIDEERLKQQHIALPGPAASIINPPRMATSIVPPIPYTTHLPVEALKRTKLGTFILCQGEREKGWVRHGEWWV